ncbi:helix-turn-helix transcriptional regulator, partial [Streptomyces exfoliatus]|uniref:helix-turn-helix transcriptional regulator n=1 Tax=Streptomyces exfoliatus TaxID=1905 RepID=UPI0004667743
RPATPHARACTSRGLWLTLRAARIDDGPGAGVPAPSDREIAVTIEETTPADRLDVFCRAHGLTARETELLGHLAEGADTGTAAHAMSLSAHTVQDHLKSVFTKTGTRHRRGLLARALGT